jgi:hypothetical protein
VFLSNLTIELDFQTLLFLILHVHLLSPFGATSRICPALGRNESRNKQLSLLKLKDCVLIEEIPVHPILEGG